MPKKETKSDKEKKDSKVTKDTEEPLAEKPKKIKAKSKVIFVEIDDEITEVFDLIKNTKEEEIYIVIPKEAVLFQSVVNFKILKSKSDDLNKKIFILTKDKIGIYLAKQAGFTVSDNIDNYFEFKGPLNMEEKMEVKAINALSNTNIADNIKKLSKSKENIFGILKRLRRNYQNKSSILSVFSEKIKRPKILGDNKITFSVANKRAVSTLIIMGLIILVVSAYIILPGATIYLSPKTNVVSQSLNITLADSLKYEPEIKSKEGNVIAMYFYETDVDETMLYKSTGKIFEGTNAKGKVTLFNESNESWPLIAKTRLQTSDGLVFRTQNYIAIPAKNAEGPGQLIVDVVADEFDIFGEIIGDKGNINGGTFFLPGLNPGNQKLVYAKSTEKFSGGITKYKEIVTEEDIFASQELIKSKMIESLKENLKGEIEKLNKEHKTNFYLLLDDNLIQKDNIEVNVPQNIVGSFISEFNLTAKMHVKVPYFNYDELIAILRSELEKHTNIKKILIKTYEQNLQFEITEIAERNDRIKLTATLQGLEQFNIDPETEDGQNLQEKIIENIKGKTIVEAENYIQNINEVNKVEIESWPRWAITIPNIPENIKIKVVSEE